MKVYKPQYVNLYQKQTSWVTTLVVGRNVLLALAALMIGLGALAGFSAWRVQRAESSASLIVEQSRSRDAALQVEGGQYTGRGAFRDLQARVDALAQLIARQDVVLTQVSFRGVGSRAGFGKRMAAIARARVDGVWLTRIEFSVSPDEFKATGVAKSPDLLPRYLQTLGDQLDLGITDIQTLTLETSHAADGAAAVDESVTFRLEQTAPRKGSTT